MQTGQVRIIFVKVLFIDQNDVVFCILTFKRVICRILRLFFKHNLFENIHFCLLE